MIGHNDAERSVLSLIRRGTDGKTAVVVMCHFTPSVQCDDRIGVPQAGVYAERINTDSVHDGGSNVSAPFGEITAEALPWQGKPHSPHLSLPPLATVFFTWNG